MSADLPDPETTEAEAITVPDGDVLPGIDDDNPVKPVIEGLREDGASWEAIWKHLEDAYNPVDAATAKEMCDRVPKYEAKAVVADPRETSGERVETYTPVAGTEAKAVELIESIGEVRRVESIERVGMVEVS
jgi:hypothetical protein